MNGTRSSLSGLMGAVALLAVAIAAIRIPWLPLRTSALFTLVVFVLLAATLGAVLKRGAAWVGFSLFGTSWLVISFASLEIGPQSSSADRIPVPMPITSMWLVEAHSSVLGPDQARPGEAVTMIPNSKGGHSLVSHPLVQACHLWHSLLAACCGALLGRWLDRRTVRPLSKLATTKESGEAGDKGV